MPDTRAPLPDFTTWPSFPFEGDLRVKELDEPVAVEPPRKGEDANECSACSAPDRGYIWVNERWRVRSVDRPTGLPAVLILETRSHFDLGDLPNLLAAELGVMTVRLERAIRSLDGVARVHVNRWGDGSAHLHLWFLARPYGRLQLRGTFLSLWDDILPAIPESQWRENLALVAAWLAEFGGHALAEPPHIQWQAPSSLADQATAAALRTAATASDTRAASGPTRPGPPLVSSDGPASNTAHPAPAAPSGAQSSGAESSGAEPTDAPVGSPGPTAEHAPNTAATPETATTRLPETSVGSGQVEPTRTTPEQSAGSDRMLARERTGPT